MTTDTLKGKDGKAQLGYLNASAGSGKPVLVVIQEWWGLNDHIRSVADRYAREGFVVFAPDLYDGKTTKNGDEAATLMSQGDPQKWLAQLHAAIEALAARDPSSKIGVTGFCMGGGLALAAAAHNLSVRACVPFYGIPQAQLADVSQIKASVLGHYAKHDNHVSPERVQVLAAALKRGSVRAELHEYDAQHAFFNDTRPEVYSPENAQLAWERTLRFLRTELA
jgi:carboxymethylenebutenolidase